MKIEERRGEEGRGEERRESRVDVTRAPRVRATRRFSLLFGIGKPLVQGIVNIAHRHADAIGLQHIPYTAWLDDVLFILFNRQPRLYGLLLHAARTRDGMNYSDKEGACVADKIQSAQIAKYACKNIEA